MSLPALPTRPRRSTKSNGWPLRTAPEVGPPTPGGAAHDDSAAGQERALGDVSTAAHAAGHEDGSVTMPPRDTNSAKVDPTLEDMDNGEPPLSYLQIDQMAGEEQSEAPAPATTASESTPEESQAMDPAGLAGPEAQTQDDACSLPGENLDVKDNPREGRAGNLGLGPVERVQAATPHAAPASSEVSGYGRPERDMALEEAPTYGSLRHQPGQMQIPSGSPEPRDGPQLDDDRLERAILRDTDSNAAERQSSPADPVLEAKAYDSLAEHESQHGGSPLADHVAMEPQPNQDIPFTLSSPSVASPGHDVRTVRSSTGSMLEHDIDLHEQNVLEHQAAADINADAAVLDFAEGGKRSSCDHEVQPNGDTSQGGDDRWQTACLSGDGESAEDDESSERGDKGRWHEDRPSKSDSCIEEQGSIHLGVVNNVPEVGTQWRERHTPEELKSIEARGTYDAGHEPSPGDNSTDAESPPFVTPMATGRSESTAPGQGRPNFAYPFDGEEPAEGQPHAGTGISYALGDHYTATVHGADELFDDEESEGSAAEETGSSLRVTPVWQPSPEQQVPTVQVHAVEDGVGEHNRQLTLRAPGRNEDIPRPKSWVEEVDSYFDDSEEEDHQGSSEMPPPQPRETIQDPESVETSPTEPRQESPSLAGHSPGRPWTPIRPQSAAPSEDITSDDSTPRDTTNAADEGWTPESLRSQTTLPSSPSSPLPVTSRTHAKGGHDEPVIRRSLTTDPPSYGGRPRSDPQLTMDIETQRTMPVNTAPWQQQQQQHRWSSLEPAVYPSQTANTNTNTNTNINANTNANTSRWSGDGHGASRSSGGSLFQRMRSIFEQPLSPTTRSRDAGGADDYYFSSARSRPGSGTTWFADSSTPTPVEEAEEDGGGEHRSRYFAGDGN